MSTDSSQSSSISTKSKDNTKNIADLRELAIGKLHEVMLGHCDFDDIDAFCSVMSTILETLKVEMAYLKLIKDARGIQNIPFIEHNDIKVIS